MSGEPSTKAGRELLADLAYTRDNYLDPILAIEKEAATFDPQRLVRALRATGIDRQGGLASWPIRTIAERIVAAYESGSTDS